MSSQPPRPRYEIRGVTPLHMIHKWSIEHPYVIIAFYFAVFVLSAIVVFGGFMPRRFAPYVRSPIIGIVTMMPGLSAQEMELYISKPIEEQMINVNNLHFIRSTSQDGFSIVAVEFYYGTDMDRAFVEVLTLMNVIQANLPATGANLKPSYVVPIDALNLPILSLGLTGEPQKGWDMRTLREFADNEVINRLKTVTDVFSGVPFGGYRRQIQVVVDREKLAAYNLSILDVKNAIDRYNVSRPAGVTTYGPYEGIVRVDTRALKAEDILNYPIASIQGYGVRMASGGGTGAMGGMGGGIGGGMGGEMGGGMVGGRGAPVLPPQMNASVRSNAGTDFLSHPRVIYVKDVARVIDTHWERRSAYYYLKRDPGTEGEIVPAVEVSIIQNPGASSKKIVPQIMKRIKQLEHEYPGVHFEVAYDNSRFVDILFENMFHELGIAILLCGIAVLFFLGEWRGTLISVITIPTSLAMALLACFAAGFTLNSGTLIGFLLSIGRLVDDTIIDVHAVERHLRMGKDKKTATIDGIAEVRLAVLASTFVLCLALTPLCFVAVSLN